MIERTIEYPKPTDETFAGLLEAIGRVGKVTESSDLTKTITASINYGAQAVTLRVSVHSLNDRASRINIQPRGEDVWGTGSRRAIDKLVRALGNSAYRSSAGRRIRKAILWGCGIVGVLVLLMIMFL